MNLSIIIPVYNADKFIFKCLSSIFSQKTNAIKYEIIAINDGSTDNSLSILYDFKLLHGNLTIISNENEGTATARNHGLELAKGDYIWFIDADDYISDNSLQMLEKEIVANEKDLLTFDYFKISQTRKKKMKASNHSLNLTIDTYLINEKDFFVWKNLYRHEVIKKNGLKFIDGIINIEDFHFNILFCNYAKNIQYFNSYLYYYNFNKDSTSRHLSKIKLNKLAIDSEVVHNNLTAFLKSDECKNKNTTKLLIDKSITGFFFSLYRFNYSFDELLFFYVRYLKSKSIPLSLNNVSIKMLFFSKVINSKRVFLILTKLKKKNKKALK